MEHSEPSRFNEPNLNSTTVTQTSNEKNPNPNRPVIVPSSSASTAADPIDPHHGPVMSKARQIGIIVTCSIVMMNNIGSGAAMTVALPDIGSDLNMAAANLQWIISAYSLTSGCFLLLFGKLADLYGRRLVFLFGTFWMGIWSLGCGFAPTEIGMDVMRGLQGLGPAAAIPASLGILAQSFEEGTQIRTVAFAAFGSGGPIGAALGNVISGCLTQWTGPSWKSAFYAQAGIAFFSCALGFIFVLPDSQTHLAPPPVDRDLEEKPRSQRRRASQVDWFGAFLVTVGLVLFTFSLGDGETAKPSEWKSAYIIVLLILSVFLIAAFVWWEARLGGWKDVEDEEAVRAREEREARDRKEREARGEIVPVKEREADKLEPLLRLAIFRRAHGKMSAMMCVAFFVWAGFNVWAFYAVLYYQTYLGLGPVLQMVRMLPLSVTGVLCTVIVALAAARIPGIILVVLGCLLMSIAPLLFALIDTSKPYWAFGFPAAIVSVFGADIIFAGGSLYVAKVALPHEQSLAGGLFNTLTQIGTSIGLSLSSILLDRTIARKAREMGISIPSGGAAADNAPKEALLAGYRAAQWLGFGYSIFAMVLALLFLRDMGIIAPKDPNKSKKRRLAILRAREDSEDQSRQTKTGEPTFSQTPGPNSRQHDDNQSVFRKTEEV